MNYNIRIWKFSERLRVIGNEERQFPHPQSHHVSPWRCPRMHKRFSETREVPPPAENKERGQRRFLLKFEQTNRLYRGNRDAAVDKNKRKNQSIEFLAPPLFLFRFLCTEKPRSHDFSWTISKRTVSVDAIISFLLLSIHVLNSEEDVFLEEVKTWRKSFFLWTYLFGGHDSLIKSLFFFLFAKKDWIDFTSCNNKWIWQVRINSS